MAKFTIPTSAEPTPFKLKDFKGVDFTNNITNMDIRRSPNAYNIASINGMNQKRNGYKIMLSLLGNVNRTMEYRYYFRRAYNSSCR